MTTLLFPGRHLLHTQFQVEYLRQLLNSTPERWTVWGRPPGEPIDLIVFAITSANQQHSRYNPIPFHVRAIGVDRFATPFRREAGVSCRIIGVPHYPPTSRFAEIVLKEIQAQTENALSLTAENCVVLCSTRGVTELYRRLEFAVLPGELGVDPAPHTPIELLTAIVNRGEGWREAAEWDDALSPATRSLWRDFPGVPGRILRLWQDPLLDDDGDLTGSRNYGTYAYGMGNNEVIDLKYGDVSWAIQPGKIVDEGCADGRLLARIAQDFPDSDLVGIEITGEFMARALERQRAGIFGGTFVHFYQRNITHRIFEAGSIDTTLCNSTIHELWSYGEGAVTVRAYLAEKFRQLRPGGRLVIRDVVGPLDKEQIVRMWLNHEDGSNERPLACFESPADLQVHLDGLSTYARFLRFAHDFRRGRNRVIAYSERQLGKRCFVELRLRDAVEFMTKKDYTANWQSEMQEAFAFWDFEEWKAALSGAGFRVLENPNEGNLTSRIYTNPWIVENRWQGSVALYQQVNGAWTEMAWPPTTVVLVGVKAPSRE